MAALIYGMCALTALLCAWLLLQAYRRSRYKLLLWSSVCFAGLTLNNIVLIVDKLAVPYQDLSVLRSTTALASLMVLLYGLIWDAK